MREQSHKQEMSAAVRGDFARLRARRDGARTPPPPLQVVPAAAVSADPEPAPVEPARPRRSFLRSLLRG